jgi:hypothetical protein
LRKESRLRVFENRMLRGIFGAKRNKITGEWGKLHNEEVNDLYCSPNIVRVINCRRKRWVGHLVRMGKRRGVYSVLVGKPEVKRPLGRPRCRWEDFLTLSQLMLHICGVSKTIGEWQSNV